LVYLDLNWDLRNIEEEGFKLHLDHWGKGYGTEALNRVLDFGFDDRYKAGCAVANIGSIKVRRC
jgi:RimJ/RimL family protein N-acetyltransferase